MSIHTCVPWQRDFDNDTRMIGVMYAGQQYAEGSRSKEGENSTSNDSIVYFGINAYWEPVQVELPALPQGYRWKLCVDTGRPSDAVIVEKQKIYIENNRIQLAGRSVIAAVAQVCGVRMV